MSQPPYNVITQPIIDSKFLTSPGEDLVPKLLMQLAAAGLDQIFGPYKSVDGKDKWEQRWADYQRFDWSLRNLPAINVFEAEAEEKDSDNAFLNGTVSIQIIWPGSFRRDQSRKVEAAVKGVLQNFFASQYAQSMLDEIYFSVRPEKVYGLNEIGKKMTWTPNVEMIVEAELVPVTILNVRYRIDLRSWIRAMEFMGRTQAEPFKKSLDDLKIIANAYQGVDNEQIVKIEVESEIKVNQE